MRRGIRFPAWYLLLVVVLGILSGCQSLRDLERFANRHHSVLTDALGLGLRRPPSDASLRYFFQQVDVTALCTVIRDWTIAQNRVAQRISIRQRLDAARQTGFRAHQRGLDRHQLDRGSHGQWHP